MFTRFFSVMSIISPQDDNFAMEVGRQPMAFDNPLYATAPAASGDPAVIHATQVVNHVLFLWTLFMDIHPHVCPVILVLLN